MEPEGELWARNEEDISVVIDRLDRLDGDEVFETVVTHDGRELSIDWLFFALGTAGGTDLAEMLGVAVEGDSIVTDPDQSTPVERVYAAGDVTGGHQQIATCVGEEARAATNPSKNCVGQTTSTTKKDSQPA